MPAEVWKFWVRNVLKDPDFALFFTLQGRPINSHVNVQNGCRLTFSRNDLFCRLCHICWATPSTVANILFNAWYCGMFRNITEKRLHFETFRVLRAVLIKIRTAFRYSNSELRIFGLFQSKHSCFLCSLISVNIGQHVSTLLFPGHHQVSPFFFLSLSVENFLPSAMLHIAGAYFTYG